MAASDKLKELQRLQLLEGRFPSFPEQDDLLSALPQLLAVVEAAEKYPFDPFSLDKLRLALSALNEQLGDLGSATESETPTPRRKIVKADRSDLEEWKP